MFIAAAIRRAGGRPRRITPEKPRVPARVAGLVLSGGADVQPQCFGSDEWVAADRLEPERDELELELLDHARPEQLPVLGICRGAQLMNVHRGGSLRIGANLGTRWSARPAKKIYLARGSQLAAVLGRERCRVNNMHRNAIDGLGDGLVVTARDGRALVQAVEAARHPFFVGVQWHPEYLLTRRVQQRLFGRLVDQATAYRDEVL